MRTNHMPFILAYSSLSASLLINLCYLFIRYQKLKKGKNSEDDSVGPLTANVSAKYVIIEEDEHDDGAWEP